MRREVRSDGCAPLVYYHCPSCQRPDQRHGPAAPAQRRGLGASATDLSATESELLIIVAFVAFVFDLCLMPVLGISFWAKDRGFRKQAAALAHAQDRTGPMPVPQPRDPYA
jgi:hypothetical protein